MIDTIYEIGSGIAVGYTHLRSIMYNHFIETIFGSSSPNNSNSSINPNERNIDSFKVVGVGFGRTGTYSLSLALNTLGFPSLHTMNLYNHPEILDMWTEEVFLPSVESQTLRKGSPSFEMILKHGYVAALDFPIALYFEEIHKAYPDCKFILTTRDSSQEWFNSWKTLDIIPGTIQWGIPYIRQVKQMSIYFRWLFGIINQDISFLETPLDIPLGKQIENKAITSYENHNQSVRSVIPPNRLLEYNVKEGYAPLCEFLEVSECPTTAFPKTHSKIKLKAQTLSSVMIPLILSMFVAYYVAKAFYYLSTRLIRFLREENYLCYSHYKTLLAHSRKRLAILKKHR